jgi:hypothetical protein
MGRRGVSGSRMKGAVISRGGVAAASVEQCPPGQGGDRPAVSFGLFLLL